MLLSFFLFFSFSSRFSAAIRTARTSVSLFPYFFLSSYVRCFMRLTSMKRFRIVRTIQDHLAQLLPLYNSSRLFSSDFPLSRLILVLPRTKFLKSHIFFILTDKRISRSNAQNLNISLDEIFVIIFEEETNWCLVLRKEKITNKNLLRHIYIAIPSVAESAKQVFTIIHHVTPRGNFVRYLTIFSTLSRSRLMRFHPSLRTVLSPAPRVYRELRGCYIENGRRCKFFPAAGTGVSETMKGDVTPRRSIAYGVWRGD